MANTYRPYVPEQDLRVHPHNLAGYVTISCQENAQKALR
jgi:hypothetical protein